MHAGRMINADGSYCDTKPGQVFEFLDTRLRPVEDGGEKFYASPWFTNMELSTLCFSPAIGTRISEIREQLPGGDLYNPALIERLGGYEMPSADRTGGGFRYRLVRHDTAGQLSLLGTQQKDDCGA